MRSVSQLKKGMWGRAGAETHWCGPACAEGRGWAGLSLMSGHPCRRDQKYSQWEFPDWIPLVHNWTCLSERYHWSSARRERGWEVHTVQALPALRLCDGANSANVWVVLGLGESWQRE